MGGSSASYAACGVLFRLLLLVKNFGKSEKRSSVARGHANPRGNFDHFAMESPASHFDHFEIAASCAAGELGLLSLDAQLAAQLDVVSWSKGRKDCDLGN